MILDVEGVSYITPGKTSEDNPDLVWPTASLTDSADTMQSVDDRQFVDRVLEDEDSVMMMISKGMVVIETEERTGDDYKDDCQASTDDDQKDSGQQDNGTVLPSLGRNEKHTTDKFYYRL